MLYHRIISFVGLTSRRFKVGKKLSYSKVMNSNSETAESCINHGFEASSGESKAKRPCTPSKIGTHDGTFHCDEVLACSMLKCLPEYKDAVIVRTRNSALLDSCDIVVDVGGSYDPSNNRFDHHQRSFSESMHTLDSKYSWKTKLSSAGLVYYHFGHRILSEILHEDSQSTLVQNIYLKMYENFLEEIDGMDNGIDSSDGPKKYRITTNLSSRVKFMNIPWNQPEVSSDAQFHKACNLVLGEFTARLQYYSTVWWPAKEIVINAVNRRHEVHQSGKIVVLGNGGVPWKEFLYEMEEQQNITPKIDFVLYSDVSGVWRVQAVNISPLSFDLRVPLKEEWRGLKDAELSSVSNINDCVFVHANGFIGGNKTREGALQMALKSLDIE